MTNEEMKQIREMMKELVSEELQPIKERLEVIEENTEITRDVLNEVVKWIDSNFRDDYPFPVEKQII